MRIQMLTFFRDTLVILFFLLCFLRPPSAVVQVCRRRESRGKDGPALQAEQAETKMRFTASLLLAGWPLRPIVEGEACREDEGQFE